MGVKKGFAIVIGVGQDLPASEKDAKALHGFLTDPNGGGFKKSDIYLHVGEKARLEQVSASFNKIIKKSQSDPEAVVYIYYSGHGAMYEDDGADSFYLLLNGYNEYKKDNTMLKGSVLGEYVSNISASKLLVFLDCCHADGMNNNRAFLGREASARNLVGTMPQGEGRVFMSSCDDHEKSLIKKGADNSIFTSVLLDALKGKNSEDAPEVHVIDILEHLLKCIPREVAKLKTQNKQTPIISELKRLDPYFFVCRNSMYRPAQDKINNGIKELDFGNDHAYQNKLKDKVGFVVNNCTVQKQINIDVNEGDIFM